MSFPRRLLTPGEEVAVEFRPHWSFLGWPLVATLAGAVLALVVAGSDLPGWTGYAALVLVGLALLWLVGRLLRWATTSTAVTTVRIVRRSGALARTGLEIRLDRVNGMAYRQTLFRRLLGCGDLLIETGGDGNDIVFDFVPHPADVQSLVTAELNEMHRRRLAPATPLHPGDARYADGGRIAFDPAAHPTPPRGVPATRSAGDRLVELDELRRRGILTAEEFEAKKAQLLEQL